MEWLFLPKSLNDEAQVLCCGPAICPDACGIETDPDNPCDFQGCGIRLS